MDKPQAGSDEPLHSHSSASNHIGDGIVNAEDQARRATVTEPLSTAASEARTVNMEQLLRDVEAQRLAAHHRAQEARDSAPIRSRARQWISRYCDSLRIDSSNWGNVAGVLVWLLTSLLSFSFLAKARTVETQDCSLFNHHKSYTRKTCGQDVWYATLLFSVSAAMVVNILRGFMISGTPVFSQKTRQMSMAWGPALAMLTALAIFSAVTAWKSCFAGCQEVR